MGRAYLFPGQGVQCVGMVQHLYSTDRSARQLLELANDLLGFRVTDVMFGGPAEVLQRTAVAQVAVFLQATIAARLIPRFRPMMVAGHSSGEFAALVACRVLTFEEGLLLVAARAEAMQAACDAVPGGMAAIIGLPDAVVERACRSVGELVVAANYNCPGQLVISGTRRGVALACEALRETGARGVLPLPVGGAFHSPLMEPAREALKAAMEGVVFREGICPIYQNVTAEPACDPVLIQKNLLLQLTSPVRWTESVRRMVRAGARDFVVCGPARVLRGLVMSIDPAVCVSASV